MSSDLKEKLRLVVMDSLHKCVRESIWDSVNGTADNYMWHSVGIFVWNPVCNSVEEFVRDSAWPIERNVEKKVERYEF